MNIWRRFLRLFETDARSEVEKARHDVQFLQDRARNAEGTYYAAEVRARLEEAKRRLWSAASESPHLYERLLRENEIPEEKLPEIREERALHAKIRREEERISKAGSSAKNLAEFLETIPVLSPSEWASLKHVEYYSKSGDLYRNYQGSHNMMVNRDTYEDEGKPASAVLANFNSQSITDISMNRAESPCPCGKLRVRYSDGSVGHWTVIRKSADRFLIHDDP
ncbi:MAG: hypothetical protein MUF81_07750 [Verrucomicrobia bacterium]|jgi:hypothetical protein|nr:hypothetical protein [Verrucomicrobiota bacterium]